MKKGVVPLLCLCLAAPGTLAATRLDPLAGVGAVHPAARVHPAVLMAAGSPSPAARSLPALLDRPLLRLGALRINAMDATPAPAANVPPPPLPAGIHLSLFPMVGALAGSDALASSYALRLRLPF